jgi:succinylglutamate desuccinylase
MSTTATPILPSRETTPLADRVVGRLTGPVAGPSLVCVAALHGNEPAGLVALRRVFSRLDAGDLRGEVVGLVGNRKALAQGRRYLVDDLNRAWLAGRIARVRAATTPLSGEDEELRDLDRELSGILAGARGPVAVVDLHSTSGEGPSFGVLDDTLANRAFAFHFPVPWILGLEEELPGTMLQFLHDEGAVSVAFESGPHDDPDSVGRAEAAVWIALEAAGVLPPGRRPEPAAARRALADAYAGLPRMSELRYRHAIAATDEFRMEPGFASFDAIRSGQLLARDRRGPVRAPETGRILMPLYQAQGDDGFFVVRRVRPFWLRLSARMRRLRLERFVHWLPGIRRDPARPGTFLVDRRIARWYALEAFHLLGFRRHASLGAKLVVSRRADRD